MSREVTIEEAVSINKSLNDTIRTLKMQKSELVKENCYLKKRNKQLSEKMEEIIETQVGLDNRDAVEELIALKKKYTKMAKEVKTLRNKILEQEELSLYQNSNTEDDSDIQKILSNMSNRLRLVIFRTLRQEGAEPTKIDDKYIYETQQIVKFILRNESILTFKTVGVSIENEYQQLRHKVNQLYKIEEY